MGNHDYIREIKYLNLNSQIVQSLDRALEGEGREFCRRPRFLTFRLCVYCFFKLNNRLQHINYDDICVDVAAFCCDNFRRYAWLCWNFSRHTVWRHTEVMTLHVVDAFPWPLIAFNVSIIGSFYTKYQNSQSEEMSC